MSETGHGRDDAGMALQGVTGNHVPGDLQAPRCGDREIQMQRCEAERAEPQQKRCEAEAMRRVDEVGPLDLEPPFRALIERSSDVYMLVDEQGNVVYLNSAAQRLFGYTVEERRGRRAFEVVHPDDLPYVESTFARVRQQPGVACELTFRRYHKDGSVRWIEGAITNLLHDPAVCAIIGNFRDITDRLRTEMALRQNEQLFRSVFDQAAVGICYSDLNGRFVRVNKRFCEITGYSAEELLRITYREITHPEDQQLFLEEGRKLHSGEIDTYSFQKRYIQKHGAMIWVNLTISLLRDDDGSPLYEIGVIEDITARKRAEEALRQSEERLQQAVRVSQIGIFDHDHRTDTIYWSPEQRQNYGWGPDEPVNLPKFLHHVYPEDRERVGEAVRRAHDPSGDGLFDIEHRIVRRDGAVRWLATRSRTFFEGEGDSRRLTRTVGAVLDVTERVQAGQALRVKQNAIETSINAIAISDVAGILTYVNPAFLRLWGYDDESEVLGRSVVDFWHFKERAAQVMGAVLNRGGWIGELTASRKDGALLELQVSASIVHDEQGRPSSLMASFVDITERKRAEEALHEQTRRLQALHAIGRAILAEQSLEAIVENALHHILLAVPHRHAYVVLFERSIKQPTILAATANGRHTWLVEAFLHPGLPSIMDVLRRGDVYRLDDVRALDQAALARIVSAQGARSLMVLPLMAQGALIGALALDDDRPNAFNPSSVEMLHQVADMLGIAIYNARLFTQVLEGRRRLQALSSQLIEFQESERRTLSRELHDELGQILTAIKINLQAVQALQAAHQIAALDQPIADSISIVDQALQQVRDLSANLRPALLDDLGLIAALRWYLDRQQQRTNITIHFVASLREARLPPDFEVVCFRIVQEAITNVVRHARARNVQVAVQQDDTEIWLTIADDGAGFDVDCALRDAAAGASAGLLGMQERAMLLGGEFSIESTPGSGTTIRARFPRIPGARVERRKH